MTTYADASLATSCAEEAIAEAVKEAKAFIASDAPLDERWAVYVKVEKFLELHHVYRTLRCHDFSWYDDFYYDRGVEVRWSKVDEEIGRWGDTVLQAKGITRDDVRSEILLLGDGGFVNDW